MMTGVPSHLSAVGFPVEDLSSWRALVLQAARHGERLVVPGQRQAYVRWAPGAGVELWAQVDKDNALVGMNPHFTGRGRLRFGALELKPGEEGTLDGSLSGWADPPAHDPRDGAYPLLVDLPDAQLALAGLVLPAEVVLQVAAFANELTCYSDAAAYDAAQERDLKFGVESLIPSGLFASDQEAARAEAFFSGHILEAEVRSNPASGAPFHVLLVQTLGGIFDVVADPAVVTTTPLVGGVARCAAWLSARLIGPS
jgi:hypothetical protein